jgi:hypothetical protein
VCGTARARRTALGKKKEQQCSSQLIIKRGNRRQAEDSEKASLPAN